MMLYLPRLLLTLTLLVAYASAQSIRLPDFAVGVVLRADKRPAGTGYVVETFNGHNIIVTCVHVTPTDEQYYFQPVGSSQTYALNEVSSVPSQDTSLFVPATPIPTTGFKLGEGKHLSIGEQVFYIGYRVTARKMEADVATITATGTGLTVTGGTADFLEFNGVAKPGFSGGPVLNGKGEVVAMVTEAWSRTGYQPNAPTATINRAVLTEAAYLLTRETHFRVNPSCTPAAQASSQQQSR